MTEIKVPRHDVNDTHVIIARWKGADGSRVPKGVEICVVETSKSAIPVDAEREGYLGIACLEGELVEEGRTIGWLADTVEELATVRADHHASTDERIVTHKARALAERLGVSLDDLPQSSVIREKDVRDFASQTAAVRHVGSRATVRELPDDVATDLVDRVADLTPAQVTAARRVMASLHGAAPAYVAVEVEVDSALKAAESLSSRHGQAVRLNDIVLRCVAVAAAEFPAFNAFFWRDQICYYRGVHVGIVVDVGGKLVVPVIRNAAEKDVLALARESAVLQMKAFREQLTAADCSDGSLTITNLSGHGVSEFIPVLYTNQSAVVAVSTPQRRWYPGNGRLVERRVAKLGMTYDHRLHTGAAAAQFLGRVKALMEQAGAALP